MYRRLQVFIMNIVESSFFFEGKKINFQQQRKATEKKGDEFIRVAHEVFEGIPVRVLLLAGNDLRWKRVACLGTIHCFVSVALIVNVSLADVM